MANLDNYTDVEPARSEDCDECGHNGALKFTQHQDEETATKLCGECIYTSSGRFNNMNPGKLVRRHEDVKRAFTTNDDTLQIKTTSFLGEFSHVFYLETANQTVQQEKTAQVRMSKQFTGKSDVFTEPSGEFVSESSPYMDVAQQSLN
jgi:hypothetical protein